MSEPEPRTEDGWLAKEERTYRTFIGRAWHTVDSYVSLLVLLLLIFVLGALVGDTEIGRIVLLLLSLFSLLLALRTSDVPARRIRQVALVFCLVLAIALLTPPPYHLFGVGLSGLATASAFLVAAVAIGRRLGRHMVVTVETVVGALCVYVILGFVFAHLFSAMQGFSMTPFFVEGFGSLFDFQYFSFVTITTLGYGDLTAAQTTGRSLAVLEALVGQIFLITAVARLVSLWGQERPVTVRKDLAAVRKGEEGASDRVRTEPAAASEPATEAEPPLSAAEEEGTGG